MSNFNSAESNTSETKKSAIKPVVIVIALVLGAGLGVLGAVFFGNKETETATPQTQTEATPIPLSKPALGIPIPQFKSTGEVREYVRAVLNAPKPTDYKFPEYFATVPYEEAVRLVNVHYPQFENKEGEALMNAVYEDPALYQEMLREATAVRDYYHPGWREQRKAH